ncbi:nitrilase family protein [Blastopirellula marina]|uniref:Nitrilase/cyanide hydratase and apolipoprotein N-acyltransferase n=1 Tax=Blastopirellula marina DSM 3645 TaxID=314230 RepID=A3ZWR8_9BACT|nr:nitrilase family protein [Blastopirellula marina]EAQ79042.1 Nitrilase/cyanide hydratase and apolipoprotein N-acyltransferase [Blastopirellula marina DSM 3645]
MIRCATVQFQHHPGDKLYNLAQIETWCRRAAETGVQLITFPEMCVTGYWHVRSLDRAGVAALAEPVPTGSSTAALVDLASRYQLIIGGGLIEHAEDGQLYNTYVVALPDGAVHRHRKLHCFISPYMSSGDQYTVFDTHLGVKLGVLICWDNNLTENARITALQGADILLAPHQTGGTASRSPHAMGKIDPQLWHDRAQNPAALQAETNGGKGREWLHRWLPSRAHDNGMFLLFSNGVGLDDDEVRTGNAMILDCYGRILAEQLEPTDAMVTADVDLDLLENCTGRRWIRGRRPELYAPLTASSGNELDPRAARFSTRSTRE